MQMTEQMLIVMCMFWDNLTCSH